MQSGESGADTMATSYDRRLGVIILAAGKGRRMHSALPKVLHEVAGRPLLSRVIRTARSLHPDRVVVIVGHRADMVQRACGTDGVVYARQREQRGTGDAVRSARRDLGDFRGTLLILSGDVPLLSNPTLERFVAAHDEARAALSVLTATLDDPAEYGRIIRGADGRIARIVEAGDATEQERAVREINTGIYCAEADFLFPALDDLRPANAQGEYYLTDVVAAAVRGGFPTRAVATADAREVCGVNSRQELARMETTRQEQLRRKWMEAGVTFEDPATVYLSEEATIGRDTFIGPNTHVKGKTEIGARCRIDGNAYLTDSTLGDGVRVYFSVVLTDCTLDAGASAGPFSHVRGGAVLAPRAEVGNFVEVKKSIIGERTKAKHLAYIGDAEVGRNTNIGAGTITCNYDGFRKHRTRIGDRVQVGSDTTLVAPLTVHDDAYVATASTLRRDVPAGALAFNPRDQKVRPGWTAAKRAKEAAKS